MTTSSKTSKEMIVVSFKEVPENICVETRFISKSTALHNKFEYLYYMNINQGNVELTPQLQNLRTVRSLTHGVQNHNYVSIPKTVTFSPVGHNTPTTSLVGASTGGQGVTFKTVPANMPPSYASATHITKFAKPKSSNQIPHSTINAPFSNPILQSAPLGTTALLKPPVETKDSASMTDPKPPNVDKEQQTSAAPSVTSVAIQCCIDDDFYEDQIVVETVCDTPILNNQLSEEEEKEEFLQYVRENSIEYKNHLRECQICGEVCKSSKYFYGHMAVHRGPKCLCFLCGQYLENESLLKTHCCVGTKRKARALLRCPHIKCSVVAVSRLELYDHLNEHNNYQIHVCSACRKSFCTAQEFLRHLLLRAKCYTGAKRNRSRLYGLRARADRRCRVRVFTLHSHTKRTAMVKSPIAGRRAAKHLCELCYRSYRNKYSYHRHVKKCAALLRKLTNRKNRQKKINKN